MNNWEILSKTLCFIFLFVPVSFAQGTEVTVKDLKESPKSYLGQTIITVGTVLVSPLNTYYKGEFIVKDKLGNSFPVNAWVPMEIPPPPPGSKTQRDFPLMEDYVGKLLKLEGKVRLDEGRSGREKREHYFLQVYTAVIIK